MPSSLTYGAGTTGGEASHTLTVNEMPVHNHGPSQAGQTFVTSGNTGGDARIAITGGSYRTNPSTATAGASWAHNNMPPYLAVYIWKRTA